MEVITVPADAFAVTSIFATSLGTYLDTASILLVLANIVFIRTARSWTLWSTVGFFSLFVLAIGFLLPIASISFLRENGFAPEMTAYLSPFLAIALCVGFAAIVYANRFLVARFLIGSETSEDPLEAIPDVPEDEAADDLHKQR